MTKKVRPSSRPKQFRVLLERLQNTFIKLGQLLAMRPDVLSQEYCLELMKLLDDVPPFDDHRAIRIIEQELGKSIDEVFRHFQKENISAASFGQVYLATLHSGEKVAVKVQRPGIRPIVLSELLLMKIVARFIDFTSILGTFKLKPFTDDFAVYTKEELDYRKEAEYIRKMYARSLDNPIERIPKLYHQYSNAKIIVMEFLEGIWLKDILIAINKKDKDKLDQYAEQGIDFEIVAENILLNSMIQPFEKTYYHADPHAANLCVMENNVIGYVDFGIVGKMDDESKERLIIFAEALYKKEVKRAYDSLVEFIQPPSNLDLTGFKNEMIELMSNWLEAVEDPYSSIRERSTLRRIIDEGMLMRKYHLVLPTMASRFYRLQTITDTILFELAPGLDMISIRYRYFKNLIIKNWKKKLKELDYLEILVHTTYLTATLPKRLDQLLRKSEDILRGSRKAISNLKYIPSIILSFFGKLLVPISLIGFGAHLVFGLNSFKILDISFNVLQSSVYTFLGGLFSFWLSRYLRSKY